MERPVESYRRHMKNFKDRVAVITGAASGIGRALAIELAQAGARLALVDIDEAGLEETARLAGRGSTHVADVSDREQVFALPQAVLAEHGAVHLLINNAGITVLGTFRDLSVDDLERVIGVNLWGVVYGTKAFLPFLELADEAWVVNISSVFGIVGVPTHVPYCTSKFGVRGFTESLDEELRGTHIGTSVVHPGGVNTNIVNSKSYEVESSARSKDFFAKNALPASKAASQILSGVRRRKSRIMVTREAPFMDLAKRILPTWGNRFIVHMATRALGLQETRKRALADFKADVASRRLRP